MIKKILIANRGEIALRIIRACKEMEIKTVAVFSEADRDALHTKHADESVCIGPPRASESYLSIPRIIEAAKMSESDAVHPGYGFLAENAKFAQSCIDNNLIFIGPSPDMIGKMGGKSMAKSLVRKIGVPVIPGSEGEINNIVEAKKIINEIGLPVILKAAAGGGGKGMRIVKDSGSIENSFTIAKHEAKSAFGNDALYIEKLIENPKHIEFQVLGDKFGNIVHIGERDCTIQRRHQKLIEESPSPALNKELREKMGNAAIKAAKTVNYESSGTVEFLLDKNKNFYFMEMNTRIQVEHPVTELIYNIDLLKEQIKIAGGEKLEKKNYKFTGHAIECRINAEDPFNNFRPTPGLISTFHTPSGHGIRVDTHCYSGYTIPQYYDSLIGKLIVRADNRSQAINRMLRALEEFIVEGIKTTIPLHKKILLSQKFVEYNYDTKWADF
ncbi:MAG: acetyl-CoA carboxylase biotin carboxylase subunit [Ignavibacteria bacterium]|nr:acetyl-CoA carboxylase biotin carboxylase subunit [Ignavibacteria bacterium]